MRSVILRRMLMVLSIAIVLAFVFMSAGYTYLSRDAYASIKLQELLPNAEAVKQLVLEYAAGNLTPEGFDRMSEKLMRAANAATCITDFSGKVLFLNDPSFGLNSDELEVKLKDPIKKALSGETVQLDEVKFSSSESMLIVGIPIKSDVLSGSVFIIKSNEEIDSAVKRLNTSLFASIAVVIPIAIVLSSIGARRIAQPLKKMSEVALKMSNGDFDVRASDFEIGEIGLLARALNTLCDNLSQSIYQLRSEKSQLNQILFSLTDGVAAIDSMGLLTHYNPALMKMFGTVNITKREDLIPNEAIWDAFDSVYSTKKVRTISHDMSGDRTLWITMSPVITQDGRCVGVVGLFKDMTEMERLEAMRREYVANVSHELRTPLTAVRGLLEPLSDGMVSDEGDRQRYYRIMLHEVVRLSRLISDMMTLSRLQSGIDYMELSRVDMDELLDDVAQSFQAAARKSGITINVDVPDAPFALTDSDKIEQVLVILIDNAIRYTPQGGTITLLLREDEEKLVVSVRDTGCGIPSNDLPHIFERFYKVDKSRKEGGTGLGLSIAHHIISKLNEDMSVESTVGEGTCFTFTVKKFERNVIALGPVRDDWENEGALGADERFAQDTAVPVVNHAKKSRPAQESRTLKSIREMRELRIPQDADYEVIDDDEGQAADASRDGDK